MAKMYAGKMPDPEEGWKKIGTCLDSDIEWFVFSKTQDHTPDWCTHKIVANGRVANKANYWLVRNKETGQIGFARDYVYMLNNRPELHTQVEAILKMAR